MERLRAEESRKTNFLPFTCDWVSVRVNNGDYGASKPTPVVSGQWIYTGTDTGTVLKISRADGVVISCISVAFSDIRTQPRFEGNSDAGGQSKGYTAPLPQTKQIFISVLTMGTCMLSTKKR